MHIHYIPSIIIESPNDFPPCLSAAPAAAAAAPALDPIQDLLGLDLGLPAPAAATPAPAGGAINLDDLLGGGDFASAPTPVGLTFPSVVVFQKDGITISLAFSKPNPQQLHLTDALATITYMGANLVGNFSLQVSLILLSPISHPSSTHEGWDSPLDISKLPACSSLQYLPSAASACQMILQAPDSFNSVPEMQLLQKWHQGAERAGTVAELPPRI